MVGCKDETSAYKATQRPCYNFVMDSKSARQILIPIGIALVMPWYRSFQKALDRWITAYGQWQLKAARNLGRKVGRLRRRLRHH